MGFYGNIATSNMTSFSFDRIYSSKWLMDQNAEYDGVFLGRYVLVEYDEPPITGYYNSNDHQFYLSSDFTTKINDPKEEVLYQDLKNNNGVYSFYYYVKADKRFYELHATNGDANIKYNSPYAASYSLDVDKFGRGYDSTAWVKRYDVTTNTYKYSMIAELNSVVPNFHIIADTPKDYQIAPYFDRDSSNVDYYMHVQTGFSNHIKECKVEGQSDERATFKRIIWDYSTAGETANEKDEDIDADIFYNKAGFNRDKHAEFTAFKDGINYTMSESGRKYGDNVWTSTNEAHTAKDTREWYIRFPSIGNAICALWDAMYGYSKDKESEHYRERFTDFATEPCDPGDKVTYDDTTMIGMINRTKDLIGHNLVYLPGTAEEWSPKNKATSDGNLYCTWDSYNGGQVPACYYYYAYSPNFVQDPEGIYFLEEGEYKIANTAVVPKDRLYREVPNYQFTQLEDTGIDKNDTIYGLILYLHQLIGTGDDDTRDIDTIIGCINNIKDVVSNINLQLKPNKLVHTTSSTDDKVGGVIETSDTAFPSPEADETKVLAGNGDWVSRFQSVLVDNAGSKNTGTMEAAKATIVSDSKHPMADNDPNTLHNNNFKLDTANKWIQLKGDADNDTITLAHSRSNIIAEDSYADTSTYGLKSNLSTAALDAGYTSAPANAGDGTTAAAISERKFEIPEFTVDKAGHVVAAENHTVELPENFSEITVVNNTDVSLTSKPSTAITAIRPDSLTDSLKISSKNNWIQLSATGNADTDDNGNENTNTEVITNDTLVVGHAWSGVIKDAETYDISTYGLTKNLAISDVDASYTVKAPNAAENDSSVTIGDNTFPVPWFSVDRAGHIVSAKTNTVTLPNNFSAVTISGNSSANTEALTLAQDNSNKTLSADTMTDTLNLSANNKWLKLTINPSSDLVTIGHAWSGVIGNTAAYDVSTYGLSKSVAVSDIDNAYTTKAPNAANDDTSVTIGDNMFEVPWFSVDRAGHIVSAATRTVGLPNVFTTIAVAQDDDASALILKGSGNSVVADTMADTLTLAEGNRWIILTSDPAGDRIKISHYVNSITNRTDKTEKLNSNTTTQTFPIQNITWDSAGHIIENVTTTYTLPNCFRNIAVKTLSSAVDGITNTPGACVPDEIDDTFSINTSNKWINIAADIEGDAITFAHAIPAAKVKGIYGDDKDQTPNFGATFEVPYIEIDEAGHVISVSSHTVTQHGLKYVADGTGNVITGLKLEPATGVFTETKENVGTLLLAGYTKNDDNANVADTDSINGAFSKLQTQILEEKAARSKAITDLIGGATGDYVTLKGIQNKINNVTNESKATMFTSPVFTGVPTAPTAAQTVSNTQIATTAYVRAAISNLINGADSALDTLKELADALGSQNNFSTVVLNRFIDNETNIKANTSAITANATAISGHSTRVDNPHSVTKSQVGLSNVTNNKQIKAPTTSAADHIVVFSGADASVVKDSGFTIATSVPQNAKFTDTTYAQATSSVLGLVKLYTSTGTSTDGTMTRKSITDAITEAKNLIPTEQTIWQKKQVDTDTFEDVDLLAEAGPTEPGDYRVKLIRTINGIEVPFYSDITTIAE